MGFLFYKWISGWWLQNLSIGSWVVGCGIYQVKFLYQMEKKFVLNTYICHLIAVTANVLKCFHHIQVVYLFHYILFMSNSQAPFSHRRGIHYFFQRWWKNNSFVENHLSIFFKLVQILVLPAISILPDEKPKTQDYYWILSILVGLL